jgi:hypothetical protein
VKIFGDIEKNVIKITAELGDEIFLRVWSSSIGGYPGKSFSDVYAQGLYWTRQ